MSELTHLLNKNIVHVAVGVIRDEKGRILISKRHDLMDQGGLWEFPGGKLENNEQVVDALHRELREETGLKFTKLRPCLQIKHDYPNKSVLLDVWFVGNVYASEVSSREGQAIKWVYPAELQNFDFPAANTAIVDRLNLPDIHLITGNFSSATDFTNKIMHSFEHGIGLMQLRAKHLDREAYFELSVRARLICKENGVQLMANMPIAEFNSHHADGLHLSSTQLMQTNIDDLLSIYQQQKLISASVHNQQELDKANQLLLDYIFISPINKTTSHPDGEVLGWKKFEKLVSASRSPVFALGGIQQQDLTRVKQIGAHGVAAISWLWSN